MLIEDRDSLVRYIIHQVMNKEGYRQRSTKDMYMYEYLEISLITLP